MSEQDRVREQLAALCHAQWNGWVRSMTQCVVVDDEGRWILDSDKGVRWQRQMQTPYADLPEPEREADRAEADRVLAVVSAALAAEYADVLAARGPWDRPWPRAEAARRSGYMGGARHALERLAERLGVHDLHERARRLPREDAQP